MMRKDAAYDDLAYEPGDPKRGDFPAWLARQKQTCAVCGGVGGHYEDCAEVTC